MSGTAPMTQVGATATVRGVTSGSIFAGSMPNERSTSQKIGTPLANTTAAAVAMKPMAGTITSAPGPTPAATNALCKAAVPELTPRAYFTLKTSRATCSKAAPLLAGGRAVRNRDSVGPAPRSSPATAPRIRPKVSAENPNRSASDMNSSTPIFGRFTPCIFGNAFGPLSIASVCGGLAVAMIDASFN